MICPYLSFRVLVGCHVISIDRHKRSDTVMKEGHTVLNGPDACPTPNIKHPTRLPLEWSDLKFAVESQEKDCMLKI